MEIQRRYRHTKRPAFGSGKRAREMIYYLTRRIGRNGMQKQPSLWKRMCGKASHRWRNSRMLWANVSRWKTQLYHMLDQKGLWRPSSLHSVHRCLLCDRDFGQNRAWFLHAHQKHGFQSIAGRAVQGQYCPQCDKLYSSTRSLHHHLRYNLSCRTFFWQNREQVIEAPFAEIDFHPQCPWIYGGHPSGGLQLTKPCDPDFEGLLHNLRSALSGFTPPEEDEDLEEALTEELWDVLKVPLPYTTIIRAYEAWANELVESKDLSIRNTIDTLQSKLFAPAGNGSRHLSHQAAALDDWNQFHWARLAHEVHTWSYLPHELGFLHFYSGHRRQNDVQACLEELQIPDGCVFYIASVDVAVNAQTCDLMDEQVQLRWLSFIRDGYASGIGSGPPCETWSIARYHKIPGIRQGGPRPLRDESRIWGKLDLKQAETEQVRTGNCLMGFSLRATILQGLCGGFAYMEHPGDPRRLERSPKAAASIWHSDIVAKCLELPAFHLLHVQQGYFGGLSAKPTGLLLTGLTPESAVSLEKQHRTTPLPQSSSIGLLNGRWCTSELKAYPPDFCRFLAAMYAEWLRCQTTKPRCSLTTEMQWLKDLCVQLDTCVGTSSVQPDFYRPDHARNSKNLFARRCSWHRTLRDVKVKVKVSKSEGPGERTTIVWMWLIFALLLTLKRTTQHIHKISYYQNHILNSSSELVWTAEHTTRGASGLYGGKTSKEEHECHRPTNLPNEHVHAHKWNS